MGNDEVLVYMRCFCFGQEWVRGVGNVAVLEIMCEWGLSYGKGVGVVITSGDEKNKERGDDGVMER
jgi:hypothetical protein